MPSRDRFNRNCYGSQFSSGDKECERCTDRTSCRLDTSKNLARDTNRSSTSIGFGDIQSYIDALPPLAQQCFGYLEIGHPTCERCPYRVRCRIHSDDHGTTSHYTSTPNMIDTKQPLVRVEPRGFLAVLRELFIRLIEQAIAAMGREVANFFSTRRIK